MIACLSGWCVGVFCWFNPLCPGIWCYFGQQLVQVMACCLTETHHHLKECWLVINECSRYNSRQSVSKLHIWYTCIYPTNINLSVRSTWLSSEGSFTEIPHSHSAISSSSQLENYLPKISFKPTGENELNHWGWVTYLCVCELGLISSENDLSPGRYQAIIWTNAGIVI